MKRLLVFAVCVFALSLALAGCAGGSTVTLDDLKTAYEDADVDLSEAEEPLYAMIDADDGILFYIDGEKVAIYEYESEKTLNDAEFEFDAINGRFGLETSNATAKEIFDSVE